MAAVTKLLVDVFGHTTPKGPTKFSDNKEILHCYVAATFQGTYASAGDANILALTTEIANSRRDGKTVALVPGGFSFVAPGREAGVVVGAKTPAISGTGITCELTQADGTTEHADGVLGTFDEPIIFGVTYTLA